MEMQGTRINSIRENGQPIDQIRGSFDDYSLAELRRQIKSETVGQEIQIDTAIDDCWSTREVDYGEGHSETGNAPQTVRDHYQVVAGIFVRNIAQ